MLTFDYFCPGGNGCKRAALIAGIIFFKSLSRGVKEYCVGCCNTGERTSSVKVRRKEEALGKYNEAGRDLWDRKREAKSEPEERLTGEAVPEEGGGKAPGRGYGQKEGEIIIKKI